MLIIMVDWLEGREPMAIPELPYFKGDIEYAEGKLPPRYPMPAIANAAMCSLLNIYEQRDEYYAFDGEWSLPANHPFNR